MSAHLSPSMICASIEGLLVRQREAKGLTQLTMAARLDVSLSTFKRWELGHAEPTLRQAIRWMRALDIMPSFVAISEGVSSDTSSARPAADAAVVSVDARHVASLAAHASKHVAARCSLHGNSPRADFQSAEVAR